MDTGCAEDGDGDVLGLAEGDERFVEGEHVVRAEDVGAVAGDAEVEFVADPAGYLFEAGAGEVRVDGGCDGEGGGGVGCGYG